MTDALPAVTATDRLIAVTSDPQTLEVVGQRVMDGESLKQIAQSWEVPVMRFIEWVVNDLARLQVYEAALRVRADQMVHETVEIADNGDGDAKRDSLRVRTRLQVAGHWDRARYGQVSRQEINVRRPQHASEYTDEQLQALIDNAVANSRAIDAQSSEVVRRAELPAIAGTGPVEDAEMLI